MKHSDTSFYFKGFFKFDGMLVTWGNDKIVDISFF